MKRAISIGILAGGKSTRMGADKALIRLGNERIIDTIAKELGGFSEIIVSAGKNRAFEEMGFHAVYDEGCDLGPMEGIRQVLKAAKEEYVFVCASDMPFIKKELVEYIAEFISSDYDCYVIADEDHIHPLCAIYKKTALPVIEELLAEKKYRLREIFARLATKYITLEYTVFDKKIVRNLNTREDLAKACMPPVFCVSGFSDSGKTGLIEKLINEFIQAGMSVGVIKHDGHDCFRDLPGSDTDRAMHAGAACAAVFSDKRYSILCNESADEALLIQKMKEQTDPPGVIILEGLKDSAYPKVEIVRREICDHSVCPPESLICIATDCISPESVNVPVFAPDDARGIFLCIRKFFCLDEI